MKIQFQDLSLRKETLRVIAQANIILEEYVQDLIEEVLDDLDMTITNAGKIVSKLS